MHVYIYIYLDLDSTTSYSFHRPPIELDTNGSILKFIEKYRYLNISIVVTFAVSLAVYDVINYESSDSDFKGDDGHIDDDSDRPEPNLQLGNP